VAGLVSYLGYLGYKQQQVNTKIVVAEQETQRPNSRRKQPARRLSVKNWIPLSMPAPLPRRTRLPWCISKLAGS
jgi:hypothetical protein